MLEQSAAPPREEAEEFYDKYDLGEIIGVGTAVVRYCNVIETGEEYAVKILEKSEETTEFISAEEQMYRTLGAHPTIIHLQDTFETSSHFFLVFELARYGELFELLTEKVFVSDDVSRRYMRQIMEGVKYIHDRNVVHRDLKLENILMMDDETLKLSDFGFAIGIDGNTVLTELCGTPGYLAPEMIKAALHGVDDKNRGYSFPVDLWACGVILYTLLVGFPPFWHSNRMILMRQIMRGKFEFLSPYWDSVSDLAKDFVSALLQVNPEKRLTAAQALEHPWLKLNTTPKNVRLRIAVFAVIAINKLKRLFDDREQHKPGSLGNMSLTFGPRENYNAVTDGMYKTIRIRKAIDECAFKIYGHWVKRSNAQNRAALFENYLPRIL